MPPQIFQIFNTSIYNIDSFIPNMNGLSGKMTLILLILLNSSLVAQPEIVMPTEINLIVNGEPISVTDGWMDTLSNEALSGKFCFKIVSASRHDKSVTTYIQLPQILAATELYRQLVLYYSLIPEEDEREREYLRVFPYFNAIDGSPNLTCSYESKGKFMIKFNKWEQVPPPSQPSLEEQEVFNQIVQASFNKIQTFGSISDEIFDEIALRNNLSSSRVKEIYQNTILWQMGCQK